MRVRGGHRSIATAASTFRCPCKPRILPTNCTQATRNSKSAYQLMQNIQAPYVDVGSQGGSAPPVPQRPAAA